MPSTVRNSLVWIFEAFERDSTYIRKRMFGSDAAYVDGLLCLVAADRDEPWNGLLVCTSQERHAALMDGNARLAAASRAWEVALRFARGSGVRIDRGKDDGARACAGLARGRRAEASPAQSEIFRRMNSARHIFWAFFA